MGEKIFEWIADYCSGTISKKNGEALRKWIGESSENREIFEKYLRIIKTYRMVEGNRSIRDQEAWTQLYGKWKKQKERRTAFRVMLAAASVLLLIGVGGLALFRPVERDMEQQIALILPGTTKATLVLANGSQVDLTCANLQEVKEQGVCVKNDTSGGLQYDHSLLKIEEPVHHTVKVPTAGEYHFILPDGTRVWINSESELTFPVSFLGDKREVFLKGEAYFEVERDKEHPFIVYAHEVAIKVLGTCFNIAAYDENQEVVTTLTQGGVNVEFAGKTARLCPGEQAIADITRQTIECQSVETGMYVSWIKGVFEYENMTLEEITEQLSRWYDVEFTFAAPEYRYRRFTGVVKKYDVLNEVLRIIEKTTDVCFMIDGRKIAVKAVGF